MSYTLNSKNWLYGRCLSCSFRVFLICSFCFNLRYSGKFLSCSFMVATKLFTFFRASILCSRAFLLSGLSPLVVLNSSKSFVSYSLMYLSTLYLMAGEFPLFSLDFDLERYWDSSALRGGDLAFWDCSKVWIPALADCSFVFGTLPVLMYFSKSSWSAAFKRLFTKVSISTNFLSCDY